MLDELEAKTEAFPRVLDPDQEASEDDEITQMDEKLFDEMHESDQMASEKLKEGIESFCRDQRTLEEMLGQLIE